MKAVILAGGRGTRIAEESHLRPKPMVTIGGMPILWHIMKLYDAHGIRDFIICLGYRGYMIKEFFSNYALHRSDAVTFDLRTDAVEFHAAGAEPWRVTLVETGESTQTGGRIKRIAPFLRDEPAFCLTYGDGLSDIDLTGEIAFHKKHGGLATVASVAPPGRFGTMTIRDDLVTDFVEKPAASGGFINGGFFVLSPKVIDYIAGDKTVWEHEPLQQLAADKRLFAFPHAGFWQPMDTLRERELLESLWASGAPWKKW
jgi:glucose-1-phosphate cytidylyltransferase